MRTYLLAAAASLALGGCTAAESLLGGLGLGGGSGTEDPQRYMELAAASDRFEVEAAQLALARARRADVRRYAEELLEVHGRSAERLAAAALEAGLSPPAAGLTAAQQRMLAELQRAPEGSFDEVYLRQQIPAHRTAIRIHHGYALAGNAAPLRPVAATAVTKAQQHLDEARRLRRQQG